GGWRGAPGRRRGAWRGAVGAALRQAAGGAEAGAAVAGAGGVGVGAPLGPRGCRGVVGLHRGEGRRPVRVAARVERAPRASLRAVRSALWHLSVVLRHLDAAAAPRGAWALAPPGSRAEEHTSELQSRVDLVCRLLLEKKKKLMKWYARTVKGTGKYGDRAKERDGEIKRIAEAHYEAPE